MKSARFIWLAALALGSLGAMSSQKPDGPEAAYVGQYALDTGGGDAGSRVSLLLFAGGDYALVYFGGMQHGTWQVRPDGRINLTEWAPDPADFALYGRHDPALGSQVRLRFNGFVESYAKIGLAGASQGPVALHPAFAPNANCYGSDYTIKRPATELAVIQLAAYQSAAEQGEEPVPFTKKLLYSFPLDKRYNDYQVVYRAEASKPIEKYIGQLQQGKLTLYNNSPDLRYRGQPSKFGERSPISAIDLKEMKPLLTEVRQPLSAHLTPEVAGQAPITYNRVAGTSVPLQESVIQLLKPLFKTSCN